VQRSLKRKLVIGLAALTAAAFAGGAYAATQNSTPNTRQAFLNDVAKRLHVTPQQLTQALNGATDDQLQAAVKAGRLTQAEANQLSQRLKQRGAPGIPFGFGFGLGPHFARPGIPGGPGGFGPGPGGFGPGPGGLAGPFGLQEAAGYLGLTIPQLFQQLSSGKSLAQIATSRGKTVTGLEQAVTNAVKTRLDKLVANKVLTAAQEKAMLGRISARVAQAINQKGLPFAGRFRGHFGGKLPTPQSVPVPPAYALPRDAPPVA
jgi:AraC-like DNA-binding protein